jgi:signal transduction histidine kinase
MASKLGMKSLLIFLPLMISVELYGQGKSFNSENYTTQNGLPQNSVKDIEEDRWGFIWLTSENGLVRFDGKSFKAFGTHNLPGMSTSRKTSMIFGGHNSSGLYTDRMQLMATDRHGELYIHEAGPATMRIVRQWPDQAPVPKILGEWMVNIPRFGYAPVSDSVFKPKLFKGLWNKFEEGRLDLWRPGFIGIKPNEAYLETKNELVYVKDQQLHLLEKSDTTRYELTLVDDYLIKIFVNNHIRVWKEGKLDAGFTAFEGSLKKDSYFLKGNAKVFWSRNGTFLYANKTLHRLYLRSHVLWSEVVLEGLEIPEMTTLYYSKEKNIFFIGSETKGLFVVKPASFQYPSPPPGTASEIYYAQAATDKNKVLSRNILFSQDGSSVPAPYMTDRESMTYYLTAQGILYYERGMQLYCYDFRNKKEKLLANLGSRLVTIIENPKDKSLFIFTALSTGILHNDSLQFWNKTYQVTNQAVGLGGDQFLLCTKDGLKWYDFSRNTVVKSILDSLNIRTALRDGAEKLWISSYGKGFYLFDNKRIYPMPLDRKLALATVHAFIDAEPGHFWLPTNNGLFRVARQELLDYAHRKKTDVYYFLFNQNDGLKTNEFNGGCDPSYLKLPDGMLSLPSLEGLVWFYPDRVRRVVPDKPLYVDYISINGKQTGLSKEIILDADFSQFDMLVTSPFFGNKENILIEYRISELKNEWSPVQENGVITLNNIRSGSYQIQIRKRNGALQNGYDYLNFDVTVKPFFYNTWWFYALAAILLAAAVYSFVRYRFRILKKRSEELEKLVASRTMQLNDKIGELSLSQNSLEESNILKDRMITLVLHDLRSPIRFLNTISNYLSRNYQSLTREDLKRSTDELKGSTTALNSFTEQFFTWISSHRENFKVVNEWVSVYTLFIEVKDLYKEIIRNEGNAIIIDPAEIDCYTDKYILDTIIRNLVDNANKNISRGVITLSGKAFDDRTELYVSDTGEGLSDEQIAQINKGALADKGIGLTIIIDLLGKIGGGLQVSRAAEKGCVFRVTIPALPIPYEA